MGRGLARCGGARSDAIERSEQLLAFSSIGYTKSGESTDSQSWRTDYAKRAAVEHFLRLVRGCITASSAFASRAMIVYGVNRLEAVLRRRVRARTFLLATILGIGGSGTGLYYRRHTVPVTHSSYDHNGNG